MEVRRPSAVHGGRAERRKRLARLQYATRLGRGERFATEMSVQREELGAVIRLVAENDDGPVVLRLRVVVERVNRSVERRQHPRARLGKEIETDVNRAMFIGRSLSSRKRRRDVEQPRFIVATD